MKDINKLVKDKTPDLTGKSPFRKYKELIKLLFLNGLFPVRSGVLSFTSLFMSFMWCYC